MSKKIALFVTAVLFLFKSPKINNINEGMDFIAQSNLPEMNLENFQLQEEVKAIKLNIAKSEAKQRLLVR
jgi:hypothetical protein